MDEFKDYSAYNNFFKLHDFFDEIVKSGETWQHEFSQGPTLAEQKWIKFVIDKGGRYYDDNQHHSYLLMNVDMTPLTGFTDITEKFLEENRERVFVLSFEASDRNGTGTYGIYKTFEEAVEEVLIVQQEIWDDLGYLTKSEELETIKDLRESFQKDSEWMDPGSDGNIWSIYEE